MKICVTNDSYLNFGDLNWDALAALGDLRLFHEPAHDLEELLRRAADADIIVSDLPDLLPGLIARCPNLKYLTLTATGYDKVELDVARSRGIPVSNVPEYGTAAVAQYAIALLLEICSQVSGYSDAVHHGHWYDCFAKTAGEHRLIQLSGKTMGIIGFGRIGRAVGAMAGAMGMQVLAYNRSRCPEGEALAEYVTLDELFARSDVISLHCPASKQTVGLINAETIAKMKDGVILINNARGSLIRSADLAAALESGKVYAAGLDVVEREPIPQDDPLLRAPRCWITPHISWLPLESRQRIADGTADNVRAFLAGKPQNVVS